MPDFFCGGSALADLCAGQIYNAAGGDSAVGAAVQYGLPKIHRIHHAVSGGTGFQHCLLKTHGLDGTVPKMGMDDIGPFKRGFFQFAGVEVAVVKNRVLEIGADDPAYGECTVLEPGARKISAVRQAEESYVLKTRPPKEIRGKAALGRTVEKPLIDDFSGTTERKIPDFKLIRFTADLGVRLGQQGFLRLKFCDRLRYGLNFFRSPAICLLLQFGKKCLCRFFRASLQDIVERPDVPGPVDAVKTLWIKLFQ